MIVCSCNRLSDRALARAAGEIVAEPERGVITPGVVFRTLGCRPDCGGCFPLVVEVIHKAAVEAEIADVRVERSARSGRVLLSARLAAALKAAGAPCVPEAGTGCGCGADCAPADATAPEAAGPAVPHGAAQAAAAGDEPAAAGDAAAGGAVVVDLGGRLASSHATAAAEAPLRRTA
ncbi:hypothetical protein [Pseudoxanthobacter sp.]|uniref:(2Fe-2S)-binding protein n=1 Tax=Pseudoxanthobacter sp. TaxID=1925742 RepID=UPI002FE17DD9